MMSLSIIVRAASQPDGGQVCSVTNLVPAGPKSQDDVDSRLSVCGFSDTVRAVCAVLCRGACAVDARRSRSKCSWVRNDGKVPIPPDPRGQMQHTVPAVKSFATGVRPGEGHRLERARRPVPVMGMVPAPRHASAVTGWPCNVVPELSLSRAKRPCSS